MSKRRFGILMEARSGSELLVDLLNSHPDILCMGEVFKGHFWSEWSLAAHAALNSKPVFGFKARVVYLERSRSKWSLVTRLANQGWHWVNLIRSNIFAQAVSLCVASELARTRGIWHLKRTQALPEPLVLNHRLLLDAMGWFEAKHKWQRRAISSVPHLDVVYERDLRDEKNQQATANRVFEFLGLPRAQVYTQYKRILPHDLSTHILNYREILQMVRKTHFACYVPDEELSPEDQICPSH